MIGAVIQATAMGIFLLAGGVVPRVSGQSIVTMHTVRNVLNGALLFGVRVSAIAWIAKNSEWGLVQLPLDDAPGLQFLVAFLTIDFCRYWLHYAHHRVPWLWTFHRVHHSAEQLDATTGLRMHVVDFIQLSLLPILLFSVVLNTSAWADWVLVAALGIGVVMDSFQHGNIRWNPRHPLARVWNLALNHPLFHSWHHTRDGHRCDGNYGNALVIWDRIFGTEVTGEAPPPLMGLEPTQAIEESLLGWHMLRRRTES